MYILHVRSISEEKKGEVSSYWG